ncbi:MAG TPA: Lrp/AsnC family transcriptional regulator [Jatrophihabitans sp.]|nr:Lrp/AsnC family transcriptional regulator [Jatrophihabitans sp.]
MTGPPLDDLDRAIVACLVTDARATFAEIGAEVSLSAPAVKRRVDRLLASGAIRGFTAVIDPSALGWRTEAYVQVYCKGTVLAGDLHRAFSAIPEVAMACTVTGRTDALVHVLARDVDHLQEVLQRIRDTASVDSTISEIVLRTLFRRATP